jgi:hypothetical protein
MANQPDVRHDKIKVPARLPTHHVEALAMQKAQMKARGAKVLDLRVDGSSPVGGDQGTDVEVSYTYRLVPPGD